MKTGSGNFKNYYSYSISINGAGLGEWRSKAMKVINSNTVRVY